MGGTHFCQNWTTLTFFNNWPIIIKNDFYYCFWIINMFLSSKMTFYYFWGYPFLPKLAKIDIFFNAKMSMSYVDATWTVVYPGRSQLSLRAGYATVQLRVYIFYWALGYATAQWRIYLIYGLDYSGRMEHWYALSKFCA